MLLTFIHLLGIEVIGVKKNMGMQHLNTDFSVFSTFSLDIKSTAALVLFKSFDR